MVIIHEDVLFRSIRDYLPPSSSSGQSQNCKIRKVQPHDNWAYTPEIISIGPLHHGKPELQPMEDLKHKYLNQLLNRRGEDLSYELSSDGKNDELLGRFIAEARKMEVEVGRCYEWLDFSMVSSDDFVRMLVMDGCFLLEFLFRRTKNFPSSDDLGRQGPLINHDILLFENQIPFSILQAFYKILTEYGVYKSSTMVEVAYLYLYFNTWENHMTFLGSDFDKSIYETDSVPSNLLHLYQMRLFCENQRRPFKDQIDNVLHSPWLFEFLRKLFSWLFVTIQKIFFARSYVPVPTLISAMEIEEAGVRFQGSQVDFRFEEGTLTIPVLTLNQESLRLLKNLMVFEFYFRSLVTPYVHTYVSFLSLLIKNPEDMKAMEKHHIIRTSGGGDGSFELVGDLLQAGFENHVAIKFEELTSLGWQDLFVIRYVLAAYCHKRRHRWYAKLMKDYFGNPWSTLGVLVGFILLVLTILQTVFTVLSYYHQQIGG